MNKEKFTRAGLESATSGLTCHAGRVFFPQEERGHSYEIPICFNLLSFKKKFFKKKCFSKMAPFLLEKNAAGALPTELSSPTLAVSLFCQYLRGRQSEVMKPYTAL